MNVSEAVHPEERAKSGFAGETLWVVAGYVTNMGLTVAGVRVLTELLAPEVYGRQSLILAGVAFMISVFINPASAGFSRFYYECKAAGTLRSLFSTVVLSLLGILAVLTLLGGGVLIPLAPRLKGFPLWVLLVSITLLWTLSVTTLTISGVLNLTRRRKAAVYWQLLDTFLKYGFVSVLVLTRGAGIGEVILGYVGASLVTSVVLTSVLVATIREDSAPKAESEGRERPLPSGGLWDREMWLKLIAYGSPFIFTSMLGWVIALSDRYLVASLVSVEAAGIYTLGYQVGSFVLSAGAAVFNRLFIPVLYSVHQGSLDHFVAVFRLFLYLFSPILVLMILFAPALVDLMAAKAYGAADQVVPLVALGLFFMICGQMVDLTFQLMKRTRTLIVNWGIPAVLNLVGNLLLIPRFGILGAAISTAVAYGVLFGTTTCLSLAYWRWSFPWGSLARALGLSLALGTGAYWVRPFWLGGGVASIMVVVAFLLAYGSLVVWTGGYLMGGHWSEGDVSKRLGHGALERLR